MFPTDEKYQQSCIMFDTEYI